MTRRADRQLGDVLARFHTNGAGFSSFIGRIVLAVEMTLVPGRPPTDPTTQGVWRAAYDGAEAAAADAPYEPARTYTPLQLRAYELAAAAVTALTED